MYEYLETKESDKRYKVVADFLGDTNDKVIVDIDCGEPRLKNFIKFKEYYANDIREPKDKEGINFKLCRDDEVDIKPDILCLFGYGGGEHTGHPQESKKAGKTIIRLSKYKPKFIVLEMAKKWEDDFKIMSTLVNKLTDYKIVLEKKLIIGDDGHYHNYRIINICEYQL
jgi:hypothetical protein